MSVRRIARSVIKLVGSALIAFVLWAAFVAYATLNGWWHKPIAPANDADAFLDAAKRIVADQNPGNLALILIEDGALHSEFYDAASQEIDRTTVFPVASMSKWITALGVMKLVERGVLDLDAPISRYLTRWHLPPSEFSQEAVTVRRLLSHTAGLTDGLGFGDYEPDETIPSLEDSLQNPRASSGLPVVIGLGRPPGESWDYSGGGYLLLQLIVEEVTGSAFEEYMDTALLQPLGLSHSTFRYIGALENRTISYDATGNPAPLYRYAASAATGFSASAEDLIRLVQVLSGDFYAGEGLFREDTLLMMRQPEASIFGVEAWGLGTILYAPAPSGDWIYGHDGQNEPALNAAVRINPDNRAAIIVLSSGNPSLATYLGFEWVFWQTGLPDFLGIGYVTDRGVRIFGYGAVLILGLFLMGVFRIWRF